jgi:hypothetical protein
MNEPKRWLDDESAPPGMRDILRGTARARPIDEGTRVRVGKRIARLTIVPVSLLTWLGAKSALAALGAVAGVATVGVATVGVLAIRGEPEEPRPVPAVRPAPRETKPRVAPPPVDSSAAPDVVAPTPSVEPTPVKSAPAISSGTEPPASGHSLAEETEFLERARRTLKTDPAFAVLLVREHGVRFPRGKLGAEQSLIEIEALYRSGRHAEARALAERKLAGGSGDLYAERVRSLLERMDPSR